LAIEEEKGPPSKVCRVRGARCLRERFGTAGSLGELSLKKKGNLPHLFTEGKRFRCILKPYAVSLEEREPHSFTKKKDTSKGVLEARSATYGYRLPSVPETPAVRESRRRRGEKGRDVSRKGDGRFVSIIQ